MEYENYEMNKGADLFFFLIILQQPGEETEERESLAQMAALAVGEGEEEDESVLRKYSKGISHVESLLALDRLRQVRH